MVRPLVLGLQPVRVQGWRQQQVPQIWRVLLLLRLYLCLQTRLLHLSCQILSIFRRLWSCRHRLYHHENP